MSTGCQGCRGGAGFNMPFSMAFQPIVDVASGATFAHEALVRGIKGEGAHSILSAVDDTNRYAFDQQCRVKAIEMASKLWLATDSACLSINFMPNAVYEPLACIRLTLDAAQRTGAALDRIIFEFTEAERFDTDHLLNVLKTYKSIGFKTAIDDFGAGYAGFQLLAKFQPDIVKIDMDLIRGIDTDRVKRTILAHTLHILDDLAITPLCEGIETWDEMQTLQDLGVRLMQGYLFAKPAFETVAAPAATVMNRRENIQDARIVSIEIPIEGKPIVVGLLADKVHDVTGTDPSAAWQSPRVRIHWKADDVRFIRR